MLVLGIESSCDETAVAVLEDGSRVLSSVVASQVAVHEIFGGVVPEIAAREHLRAMTPCFNKALNEAGVRIDDIDLIAVTQGPGLIGALLVGISFAKGLAMSSGLPIVPVDHVNAHVHGAFLGISRCDRDSMFPCLALVVSGGHTNLYYMRHETDFALIASTIDDACGESFDKVAKLLGLPYPGGPKIETLARQGNKDRFSMPMMISVKQRMEFSYSGLKTHMVNLIRKTGPLDDQTVCDLAAAFQAEALGQLIRKLQTATERYPSARSILVAGGVAANLEFRRLISDKFSIPAYFPSLKYCADNAAMIASLGWYEFSRNSDVRDGGLQMQWDAYPSYDFEKHFSLGEAR